MIYITQNANANNATPYAFRERKLDGQAPVSPESAGIYSLPSGIDYVYNTVVENLHGYLDATLKETATYSPLPMSNVLKPFQVPCIAPVLQVHLEDVTETTAQRLQTLGMSQLGINRKNWIGQPPLTAIGDLMELGARWTNFTEVGNAHLAAYLAHHLGWKALGAMTIATTATRKKDTEGSFFGIGFSNGDENGAFEEEKETQEGVIILRDGEDHVARFREVNAGDMGTVKYGRVARSARIVYEPLNKIVPVEHWWIAATDAPENGGGHVFPYFYEMMHPSRDYTCETFFRFFKRSFADSMEQFEGLVAALRLGFLGLKETKSGRELQHAYMVMKLAVEAGAGYMAVFDGAQYSGSIIVKPDASLLCKGTIVKAVQGKEFANQVRELSSHSAAVEEICRLLSLVPTHADVLIPIDPKSITGNRVLHNRIMERQISVMPDDQRLELEAVMKRTRFVEKYYEVTPENLKKVLQAINGLGLMPDQPMSPALSIMFSEDNFVEALSAFGDQAPSFNFGRDTFKVQIHAKEAIGDENFVIEPATGRRRMQYIPFKMVAVSKAAADLRGVRMNSQMFFPNPRKQSGQGKKKTGLSLPPGYVDRSRVSGEFGGDKTVEVYKALQEFTHAPHPQKKEVSRQAEKRKPTEDLDKRATKFLRDLF